jgi:hypothetical protein
MSLGLINSEEDTRVDDSDQDSEEEEIWILRSGGGQYSAEFEVHTRHNSNNL